MFKSKLSKVIVSLLRRVLGVTRSGAKRLMRAMLRSLMAMGRRARLPVAGFVLPTVTMVLLVVILLTVAITLRSFDRANMARNVRVNQQVLAAATPALDRAKAKIQYLLGEGNQVTGTPSDRQLYQAMSSYPDNPTPANPDLYTFGDEERLVLRADLSQPPNGITSSDNPKGFLFNQSGAENEAINTAWRYPVDTNNDGSFDTFTLYGIYFRTPRPPAQTPRTRKELDARTPPMRTGSINPACERGEGTVASLVGDSGWERITGRLQKSFFVYTVNVPITQADIANGLTLPAPFQAFPGTTSISALEYQQDQSRIPLSNNAVVYEDDLEISPGPALNLNGRIFTNSNLLVTNVGVPPNPVQLFQVSSQQSCFYDQENSRIVVGGNVVNGWSGNTGNRNPVGVHLFRTIADGAPNAGAPTIDADNQSVTENSLRVLYNNNAYSQRLNALVEGQKQAEPDPGLNDPASVRQAQQAPKNQSRTQALQDYFKERLRKVPFAEPPGVVPGTNYIQGSGESLRPIDAWSLPTNGTTTVGEVAGPTGLNILPNQLPAEDPDELLPTNSENFLGNRVTVGNNLPAQRWNVTSFTNDPQQVDGNTRWENSDVTLRTRTPQVTKLGDVGATDRGNGVGEQPGPPGSPNPFSDGFWERSAAERPRTPLDGIGGLRVITSAGVYDRTNSFLPPPTWIDGTGTWRTGPLRQGIAGDTYDDPETLATEQYSVVWPDSMPMSPLGPGSQVWNNTNVAPDTGSWTPWLSADWSTPIDISATLPVPQQSPNFVDETLNVANRQFAKGDLRMRATAVYQYANSNFDATTPAATQPTQTPLACVSSYYDPSNASTARNISTLPDVSGEGANAPDVLATPQLTPGTQQAFIGSNNGITYAPPRGGQPGPSTLTLATGLLSGGDPILAAQANMVFPDGRFANGPLRTALQVPVGERTLAQQAAIDSTKCALQILDGTIAPTAGLIPDGAIQEVAFINGREVKAIDRDNPNTRVNEAFTLSSPLGTAPPAAQLTGDYNQPLEEREPLEIRATQLDLGQLKNSPAPTIPNNGPSREFLLPNSGIIYASRDDALPDRSSRSTNASTDKTLSPTDNLLDPTRKPNGIVLINGQQLFRGPGPNPIAPANLNAVVIEKGLTLVSNLPAYIKGNFNLHGNIPPATPGNPAPPFTEVEEFTQLVTNPAWGNFYQRTTLDPNFACRKDDPRLPNCTLGDFWRPATVLADAVTLLSQNYRFGFRNEGDFDLRNNAGAAAVLPRRQQGFYNNNFVTNGLSSGAFLPNGNLANPGVAGVLTDATYVPDVNQAAIPLWSSYFNNFVTPVQRRGNFPEYVMEVCRRIPVAACTDADWFVDPLAQAPNTPRTAATAAVIGGMAAPYVQPNPDLATQSFQAGSTVDPPLPALQRFPRRVAFDRGSNNPPPFGITNAGTVTAGSVGRRRDNALWFAAANNAGSVTYDDTNLPYVVNNNTNTGTPGTRDGSRVPLPTLAGASTPLLPVTLPPALPAPYSGSQPLLVPVPQLMGVTTATADQPTGSGRSAQQTGWIPRAMNVNNNGTTFNLIVGAGDTPSRALNNDWGDFNGGLQNLPRFLEAWSVDVPGGTSTFIPNNIKGSFIQQNRSAFSTAPYLPILPPSFVPPNPLVTLFALGSTPLVGSEPLITYNIQGSRIPYFTPPTRNWGYDVGLLSQPPDLFTQKFTTPATRTQPAEYFREVPRNDPWVTTLMCSRVAPDQPNNPDQVATSSRPAGC
jgi:hypothetical protein